jgi:hypothetical protein
MAKGRKKDWLQKSLADTRSFFANLPENKRKAIEYDAEFRREVRGIERSTSYVAKKAN